MKKKISLIFDIFPSEISGGLVNTYERMISLLSDDYDFEIISLFNSNLDVSWFDSKINVYNIIKRTSFPSLHNLKIAIQEMNVFKGFNEFLNFICYFLYIPILRNRLKRNINQDNITIVVSPSTAIFIPKNIRFILEVHSSYDYFFGSNTSFIGKLQGKLMRKPALILFRTRSDALKGQSKFNSYYIYNFFDGPALDSINLSDIKKRGKKIISIGRLAPEKNLLKMLECAKSLKEKCPDFQLDIYGTGPMEKVLLDKIKTLDLGANVCLKGFCSDKSIYENYSLLWLTSDYEGLALVIIEGKSKAVPTISTNWGNGVFEEINDNIDGFVCQNVPEIVEKTLLMWKDPTLLYKISKNALDDFSRFNREEAYKSWKNILNKYLKNDLTFKL